MVKMPQGDISAKRKILSVQRQMYMYVHQPHQADAFIPEMDALNILLFIQMTDEEAKKSRAGMRFRRKVSPMFKEPLGDGIDPDFSVVHMCNGETYLRAEFHCHTVAVGKRLRKRIWRDLFA